MEAAIPTINMKYLSPVAGFRAEISKQGLQQKAPIGNKGYKVINTQRTTYTIMVVQPTPFMPATVGIVKVRSGTFHFSYLRQTNTSEQLLGNLWVIKIVLIRY